MVEAVRGSTWINDDVGSCSADPPEQIPIDHVMRPLINTLHPLHLVGFESCTHQLGSPLLMATVTYAAPESLLRFVAPSPFTGFILVLDWKPPTIGCVLRTNRDKLLRGSARRRSRPVCHVDTDQEAPSTIVETDLQIGHLVPPTSDDHVDVGR